MADEKEMLQEYEAVIGVEIHAELSVKTKLFCSCSTAFGATPNTQICPVCMGLPGAMPSLNAAAMECAVRAGAALGSKISPVSAFDRKNYYYPDLPKGYQISQYFRPICTGGSLEIGTENGKKRIGITRIHMEEDAGKLIHSEKYGTLIDCNRCGVPLIEIVSEPDLRSGAEAAEFFRKIRAVLMYAGVTDGKMNEGSLRCDINLSVRKKGDTSLGVRTETKNLNSFRNVEKAAECEFERQLRLIKEGKAVVRETRRFDADRGVTFPMRKKESAEDYRYYPEPDLLPVILSDGETERIRRSLPEMPEERVKRYFDSYGIPASDGALITAEPSVADWFERAAKVSRYPRICANLVTAELLRRIEQGEKIPAAPSNFAAVADMAGEGEINSSTAKKLAARLAKEDFEPRCYVREKGLYQINSDEELRRFALSAVEESPSAVADYIKGKDTASKAVVGKAMALSRGRANAEKLSLLVCALLEEKRVGGAR